MTFQRHRVFRTEPLSEDQARSLRKLQLVSNEIDFWSEPSTGRSAVIMAIPDHVQSLQDFLGKFGVQFQMDLEDVQM